MLHPRLVALAVIPFVAACTQTQWRTNGVGPSQVLRDPAEMVDLEGTDRVNRLARLADSNGTQAPELTQVAVPADLAGAVRPVPVLRVVFDAAELFGSGSAEPLPETQRITAIIADNMRHDVPDVRLTILGHTDAAGDEGSNEDLSRRRALSVMRLLIADGVNAAQLSTVAIGSAQPIAPNADARGRARNRRVEFLLSSSESANLSVVARRPVNPSFLSMPSRAPVAPTKRLVVLKPVVSPPSYRGPADVSEASAARDEGVTLAASGPTLLVGAGGDSEGNGSPVSLPVAASLRPPG